VLDDREDASAGRSRTPTVGYPVQVTIGKHVVDGKAEVKVRRTGVLELVPLGEVVAHVRARLDALPKGKAVGRA
jgi:prolyl-tRNA synthetase